MIPPTSENGKLYGGGGLVTQSHLTLVTPRTVARQAPLSMGFLRQECCSGLPFPSPGYSMINWGLPMECQVDLTSEN